MTAEEAIEELKNRVCLYRKNWLGDHWEIERYLETYEVAIEALEKVEEYKHLEEQGLLLRLPVALGQTLYHILACTTAEDFGKKYIDWFIVTNISIDTRKEVLIVGRDMCNNEWGINSRGIGETVFLTRKEAEQKLKEMEG